MIIFENAFFDVGFNCNLNFQQTSYSSFSENKILIINIILVETDI